MIPHKKIPIEVGPVQKTLLLPLWGRAIEAQKRHPLLVDTTAVSIIDRIDYDFSTQAKNLRRTTQLAWIVRSLYMDSVIRKFLSVHPAATVVNIGCGLDTTYERVDNGKLLWYDLDLPDVIALRKKFMDESDRRKFLPGSVLDEAWLKTIAVNDNLIMMAAGVFYYLEEDELKVLFKKLASSFAGSQMVFDISSPFGVRAANKIVIEESGLDERSHLRWGIDDPSSLSLWDERIEILESFPLFKRNRTMLPLRDWTATLLSDFLKIQSLVHLRFISQEKM